MNTEPQDHLQDDLDITAELPQLEWQEEDGDVTAYHFDDDLSQQTGTHPIQAGTSTSASTSSESRKALQPGDSSGRDSGERAGWPTVDELVVVRNKIVNLEATVLDAELKLTKLDKQHQELQARHAEVRAHDAEMTRDRERLDVERNLLLENRHQLTTQIEHLQADAAARSAALQQQLDEQRQQTEALRAELATQQTSAQAQLLQHQDAAQQLTTALDDTQALVTSLTSNLQANALARSQQEAAAATLARNLSQELLEKQALRGELESRDLRIGTLEKTQQDLSEKLLAAQDRHHAALAQIEQQQTNLAEQTRKVAELQAAITAGEQRAARISEQLETEQGRVQSGKQEQERLTRLAAAEHASYESARQELASRLLEMNALQEQLTHSRAEAALLSSQLAERDESLRARDELLTTKQQLLQLATDNQAAAALREAALTKSLAILEGDLQQTQTLLQERAQTLQSTEEQLAAEHLATQQVQDRLAALQTQLQQTQALQRERDQFILDQASELDQARQMADDLGKHLAHEQAAHAAQRTQLQALQAELMPLRAERDQQAQLLAQTQQALDAKHMEQGASAKQVEALQQELRQHVDALTAIRRDIHQVAQQSRYRESEPQVRTLVRVDDESVVHLLNKPVMVIGRANDAEICIHTDSISRRHACLRVGRDVVIVEDLDSTNGCYVNGKRVKRQLLKDGDRLEIGTIQFRFAARTMQS